MVLKISRRTMLAGMSLLACKPSFAQEKRVFRAAMGGSLSVVDPYYGSERDVSIVIGEMLFDTLFSRDPKTFENRPLLATGFTKVDDLTLEIDLRTDVKWHDGKPFTADDVVYTLNYIADPASKISNAQWSIWMDKAEALGKSKVRLRMKSPFGPAIEYLAQVVPILPQGFYANGTGKAPDKIIGTGPYKLVSFTPNRGASLTLNTDYFTNGPKGRPTIENIEVRSIPDPATQLAELMAGGVDWIWRLGTDQMEQVASVPGIKTTVGGTMRIFWVGFEARKPPFNDVRVRQAVAHAIDRETLVKNLMGDGTKVLNVPCYPTQVGCLAESSVKPYAYNPEAAKRLLKEAGFGSGLSTVMTIYRNSPDRPVAEAIQGYLRAVGIDTSLNVTTVKSYLEDIPKGNLPLRLESYGQLGINDASIMVRPFFGGGNQDSYRDPEAMDLVKRAEATANNDERRSLYEGASRRVVEQAMGAPLFIQQVNYAYSDRIVFEPGPDENPRLYRVKWA